MKFTTPEVCVCVWTADFLNWFLQLGYYLIICSPSMCVAIRGDRAAFSCHLALCFWVAMWFGPRDRMQANWCSEVPAALFRDLPPPTPRRHMAKMAPYLRASTDKWYLETVLVSVNLYVMNFEHICIIVCYVIFQIKETMNVSYMFWKNYLTNTIIETPKNNENV